jgi:hypothetical protein
MIQKVAEVFVLRRQFGITGVVTREEMSRELAPEAASLPTEHRHPEILASAEETVDVPAVRSDRVTKVAARQGTGDPDGSIAIPTATDFWRAVRAAATRCGEDAQGYVRNRSGGETDLRELAPVVALQIYREALAAIQSNGTAPNASVGASPFQPTPKTRGKLARDHTEFWRQVNEAARVEGDPDGAAWLARLAGGVTDSRQLDDATFTGLLAVARRVAGGEARTKDPEGGLTPQAHAEEASKTPQSPVTSGAGARPVTRDQVREIQRIWRDRKIHPNTQCEQVRQITGNHMILARMTEVQAAQLLARLQREGAATP